MFELEVKRRKQRTLFLTRHQLLVQLASIHPFSKLLTHLRVVMGVAVDRSLVVTDVGFTLYIRLLSFCDRSIIEFYSTPS